MSRATVSAAVQEVVASGLVYQPVRLPGRAAMPLELSLRGQEAAVTSETD